jgi:signal transduction histidine kinase
LDSNTAMHLYRIAQEAVTNAAKHGHVSAVSVELSELDKSLILNVTDDGIGFPEPLPESPGLGLRIMSSRAGMIGGSVSVTNRSQGGVTVTCRLPVPSNKAKSRKDLKNVSP